MARSKGNSTKDLADWRRLNRLAEEHGWSAEEETPRHRIYFVEGTKQELLDMGYRLSDLDAEEDTDGDDEPEQESGKASESEDSKTAEAESEESEPESDAEAEPETDAKPEPKPRSRNRYFGGR